MPKALYVATTIALISILLIGCSGGNANPAAPSNDELSIGPEKESCSNRILWGVWDLRFDPVELKVVIEAKRNIQAHFKVNGLIFPPVCDDCLKISINSFDPVTRILDADVTLRNPTQKGGFDIRGILFTGDPGYIITNADGWTSLFDIPGGESINPFKAFAKNMVHRIFFPNAKHTCKYLIFMPTTPDWGSAIFAVETSWPKNCAEPYAIKKFQQLGELAGNTGASVEVKVDVLDWQYDVNEVSIAALELTGEEYTQFQHINSNTWGAELTNVTGLELCEYDFLLGAKSINSGNLALYQYVTIEISEPSPSGAMDVTPPWLSFFPQEIVLDGNYAYVAGHVNGLHIFDITDPENPFWVNRVDTPAQAVSVDVSDGYAYVADDFHHYEHTKLHIIDIDPPEEAHIVKSIGVSYPDKVIVSGNYAYVGAASYLRIFDITSPADTHLVKSVYTPLKVMDIAIDDGYAYLSDYGGPGLTIVDIDPPEEAHVFNKLNVMDYVRGVEISNGYALLNGGIGGLALVDIDPPQDAHIVKIFDILLGKGLAVADDYAYASNLHGGVYIIDISSPEDAYILNIADTPRKVNDITILDGIAYLADEMQGIHILDISPPENASIINTTYSVYGRKVAMAKGYAYVVGSQSNYFHIIDIDPPESAHIITTFETSEQVQTVAISGDYAYVIVDLDLIVVDISSPASPYIAFDPSVWGMYEHIVFSGDYAYALEWQSTTGFSIIDINPPEDIHLIKDLAISYDPNHGLAVSGGYAYRVYKDLTDFEGHLDIIDIDPPETASIIKTMHTTFSTHGIDVSGEYAYIQWEDGISPKGLHIIDIDPPQDAHTINYVDIDDYWIAVKVSGGYAYVSGYNNLLNGILHIMDINPPEAAHIVCEVPLPSNTYKLAVNDNIACLANTYGGLRIIQLW